MHSAPNSFEERRPIVNGLIRALTVEKNPTTESMDARIYNLYVNATTGARSAVNTDNVLFMEEAAWWLRKTSQYTMVTMNEQ